MQVPEMEGKYLASKFSRSPFVLVSAAFISEETRNLAATVFLPLFSTFPNNILLPMPQGDGEDKHAVSVLLFLLVLTVVVILICHGPFLL